MSNLNFSNDTLDAGSVYDSNRGKIQEEINANSVSYVGLAANVLTKKTRTIQEYDADTETYVDREVNSYWTDELRETGVYNIRSTESKTIYDLPSAAKGTGSIITVVAISDRAYQRLEAKTGTWFRVFLYTTPNPATPWVLMSGGSGENDGTGLPEYYDDYMSERIAAVKALENSISANSDSFIFITDYHIGSRNMQNSQNMIKRIIANTGITKLMFGGDAYATATSSTNPDGARAMSQLYVPQVYSMLQSCAPEFFSVIGNHEWNHLQSADYECLQLPYENSLSGVYNLCIKRHESCASEMSAEGNYFVDNKAKQIRYFFLQEDGDARPTPATIDWLGTQLEAVPSGYHVVVFAHYVFIGTAEGVEPGTGSYSARSYLCPKFINDMLQAFNSASAYNLNTTIEANDEEKIYQGSYDFTGADGGQVIGALCGHVHTDHVIEKTNANILSISTAGDLCKKGNGDVRTYTDGQGNVYERTPGTVREQAFDVVHIDLAAKKIYLTRFGGGFDREFSW